MTWGAVSRVIGVADAVIIVFSGDLVFDHPLGQVIVIPGGDTAAGIYDLGNSGDNSPVPCATCYFFLFVLIPYFFGSKVANTDLENDVINTRLQ